MPRFVAVAKQSLNPVGGTLGVVIAGTRLVLVKLQDEVCALEDRAGPLSKGQIVGGHQGSGAPVMLTYQDRLRGQRPFHGELRDLPAENLWRYIGSRILRRSVLPVGRLADFNDLAFSRTQQNQHATRSSRPPCSSLQRRTFPCV